MTGRSAPSEASILIPPRMLLAMVSVLYFLKIIPFPCLKKLPILKYFQNRKSSAKNAHVLYLK